MEIKKIGRRYYAIGERGVVSTGRTQISWDEEMGAYWTTSHKIARQWEAEIAEHEAVEKLLEGWHPTSHRANCGSPLEDEPLEEKLLHGGKKCSYYEHSYPDGLKVIQAWMPVWDGEPCTRYYWRPDDAKKYGVRIEGGVR